MAKLDFYAKNLLKAMVFHFNSTYYACCGRIVTVITIRRTFLDEKKITDEKIGVLSSGSPPKVHTCTPTNIFRLIHKPEAMLLLGCQEGRTLSSRRTHETSVNVLFFLKAGMSSLRCKVSI